MVTPKVTNPIFIDTCPLKPLTPLQSPIEPDLLSDILHTLPQDDATLSQLSDEGSIPSHYLHDANHNDRELSPNCEDSTHCDDAKADNNLQCSDKIFLQQSPEGITCDLLLTSNGSSHVKPAKLSIPKKSVSTSLFTPKITNPIFASDSTTNSSSTGSNSFTSESPLLQDALNFVLLSQLDEDTNDDVFSLAGNNSDMPSHHLCGGNHYNNKSETSLNEFSHCSTNKTDDNGCVIEEKVSLKNCSVFVNRQPELSIPRKSVSLPAINPKPTNPNFDGVTPACTSTSLFQSSNKSMSPSAELSNLHCKQTNYDVSLSQLSINSTMPSQDDLSNEKHLSHYFDDGPLQNVHNIDTSNSLQANVSFQDALLDLCLEEMPDVNSINPIFAGNHEFSATNLLATATLGEEYRVTIEELDIDTISQFSNSDTNSEFNGCADSEFNDFNFGYT